MSRIAPCLWFESQAEEAARFYVSLLPGSSIDTVQRSPIDTPSGPAGSVLAVQFTLAGQRWLAMNGGAPAQFNHAVSFQIDCAGQPETDRLWEGLLEGGGVEEQCGWLRDRFGVSWQVVPTALPRLLADPDPARARRAAEAMMKMIKLDIAELERAAAG
jgi:predicted 3-demethylubiquinone-9 3-methyltransferase (glyoxalase superfamily)